MTTPTVLRDASHIADRKVGVDIYTDVCNSSPMPDDDATFQKFTANLPTDLYDRARFVVYEMKRRGNRSASVNKLVARGLEVAVSDAEAELGIVDKRGKSGKS